MRHIGSIAFAAVVAAALMGCEPSVIEHLQTEKSVLDDLQRQTAGLPDGPERKAIEHDIVKLRATVHRREVQLVEFLAYVEELQKELVALKDAYIPPRRMNILFSSEAQDWDGDSADDGVRLRIEFRDADDDPIKVRGSFQFDVHLSNPITGGKGRKIATIFVSEAEALKHWRHTGYNFFEFKLRWPEVYLPSKVFVAVTFTPTYGRPLWAAREFKVKR